MSGTSNSDHEKRFCTNCGETIDSRADVCPKCGVSQGNSDNKQSQRTPSSRWKAAFVGSIAAIFFGWFPFLGPIGAGAVSGYLRGIDNKESAITGTLATVLASIPLVLLGLLFFTSAIVQLFTGEIDAAVGGILGTLIVLGLPLVYFYGCGMLGGYIGAEFSNRSAPRSN